MDAELSVHNYKHHLRHKNTTHRFPRVVLAGSEIPSLSAILTKWSQIYEGLEFVDSSNEIKTRIERSNLQPISYKSGDFSSFYGECLDAEKKCRETSAFQWTKSGGRR